MAQEALTKASQMERSVLELNAKLKALMDENTDLKEQLYSALEQHTTKSCESETSKVSTDLIVHNMKITKSFQFKINQACTYILNFCLILMIYVILGILQILCIFIV